MRDEQEEPEEEDDSTEELPNPVDDIVLRLFLGVSKLPRMQDAEQQRALDAFMLEMYYIIDDDTGQIRHPVTMREYWEWCIKHCNTDGRPGTTIQLAKTVVSPTVWVSTIFMTIDHGFDGGKPVLYETMVFGGEFDSEYQRRYRSKRAALIGHQRAVAEISGGSHN